MYIRCVQTNDVRPMAVAGDASYLTRPLHGQSEAEGDTNTRRFAPVTYLA